MYQCFRDLGILRFPQFLTPLSTFVVNIQNQQILSDKTFTFDGGTLVDLLAQGVFREPV